MADLLSGNVDKYAFVAQSVPALLVAMPIGFAVAVWFPKDLTVIGSLGAIAVTCGITVPLSQLAGVRGKQLMSSLFDCVGGLPSTRFLRHNSDRIESRTRLRYNAALGRLIPDKPLPTAADEEADGAGADRIYASCVDLLREQTRDNTQYPLVHAFNTTFGFRRNSLGVRRFGIWAALVGLLACLLRVILYARTDLISVALVGAMVGALVLMWWVGTVKPDWVRQAADDYALRLLDACDKLVPAPTALPASPSQTSP